MPEALGWGTATRGNELCFLQSVELFRDRWQATLFAIECDFKSFGHKLLTKVGHRAGCQPRALCDLFICPIRTIRVGVKQGDVDAQFALGGCYLKGEGVLQDATEAIKWLYLAAEQGHAEAQYGLGYHHYTSHRQ